MHPQELRKRLLVHALRILTGCFFFFFPLNNSEWVKLKTHCVCCTRLCSYYYYCHHYVNHCKSSLPALTHSFLHHSLFTVLAHKLLNKSDTESFRGLLLLQVAFICNVHSQYECFVLFFWLILTFWAWYSLWLSSHLFSTRCTKHWLYNYIDLWISDCTVHTSAITYTYSKLFLLTASLLFYSHYILFHFPILP